MGCSAKLKCCRKKAGRAMLLVHTSTILPLTIQKYMIVFCCHCGLVTHNLRDYLDSIRVKWRSETCYSKEFNEDARSYFYFIKGLAAFSACTFLAEC